MLELCLCSYGFSEVLGEAGLGEVLASESKLCGREAVVFLTVAGLRIQEVSAPVELWGRQNVQWSTSGGHTVAMACDGAGQEAALMSPGVASPQSAPFNVPESLLLGVTKAVLQNFIGCMSRPISPDDPQQEKHLHVNDYLRSRLQENLEGVSDPPVTALALQAFYAEVRDMLPETGRHQHLPLQEMPGRLAGGGRLDVSLFLWQLAHCSSGFLRGAPSNCEVANVLQKIFFDPEGLNTERYPVDVVFGLLVPQRVGDRLVNFSVGLSVGATTISAAYFAVLSVMDLRPWEREEFMGVSNRPRRLALARALLSCMEIHAVHAPAESLEQEVMKSIKTKSAAANRARPNALQLRSAFLRLAEVELGSRRRSKPEILAMAMAKYNRGNSVKSEHINQDEITAVKFLATQSSEFLSVLQRVWNGDKVQYSAVTLGMLSAPYLQAGASLPVTKKENQMWYEILTPTPDKYLAWIQRLKGKFQARVQETYAREKKPNMRSHSAAYRDPEVDREMVWRMACLWQASLPTQGVMSRRQTVAARQELFQAGHLDEDLKVKVKAMDPSFKFEDLRYVREEVSAANSHACLASDAEQSEKLVEAELAVQMASVEVFKLKLHGEEAAWSDYRLRLSTWEDATEETKRQQRLEILRLVETAVSGYANLHFAVESVESVLAIANWLDQKLLRVASGQIAARHLRENATHRVEVMSFSALGQQYSVKLSDLALRVGGSLNAFPARSCCLVALPNSPSWGHGAQGGLTLEQVEKEIVQGRRDVLAEFCKPEHGVLVKEVWIVFDRDLAGCSLQCPMLMLISNAVDGTGRLVSLYAKSLLWKRSAVSEPVRAMPKEEFRDWTIDQGIAALPPRCRNAQPFQRRQWNSGVALWKTLLRNVFEGIPLAEGELAHVREWTLNDDCLPRAVMELEMERQARLPTLSYAGCTFNKFVKSGGGPLVKANVEVSIKDHLSQLYRAKKYQFPGVPPVQEAAPLDMSGRPVAPQNLELCAPSDALLPLKQMALDAFTFAKPEIRAALDMVVRTHDEIFNPSGVPWKLRRLREEVGLVPVEDAARQVPRPGAPTKVEDLQGPVVMVPGIFSFQLVADGQGQLFLNSLEDSVVAAKTPLFHLRGRYLMGVPAVALMAAKTSWIEYKLTPESVIVPMAKFAPEDQQQPLSPDPVTLKSFLLDLERRGHVEPKLRLHGIQRRILRSVPGNSGAGAWVSRNEE